jgi:hypothetical protein
MEEDSYVETYHDDFLIDKVVLIVGDSFALHLEKYLSKIYKQVIYVRQDIYTRELLLQYNPDIVVFLRAERYMYHILDFNV